MKYYLLFKLIDYKYEAMQLRVTLQLVFYNIYTIYNLYNEVVDN